MKYTKTQKLDNGGFRVAWFIPIEMVLSGAMLGLSPIIGVGWSIVLIGAPALYGLYRLSKLQDKLSEPYRQQEREKLSKLTTEELLDYLGKRDFFEPEWYEEQVLSEMFATIIPLNRIKFSLPKIHSSTAVKRPERKAILAK